MKAAIVAAPGKLEIRDIPTPEPGPCEALVQIEACGLCGTTDRHIVEGHQAHHPAAWYPAILGHEAVGKVIRVGERVAKFKVGDRVTRPVALWPGTEKHGLYSAWGGVAEWGLVRDASAPGAPPTDYTAARRHVVSPALSVEDAVAAISISEVASWMGKLGELKGRTIVIGGTGFAACVMSQCAKAAGARAIIALGRSEKKFEWVRRNGATHTVLLSGSAESASAVKAILKSGADWFLDAAGHQVVFEIGLACLRSGGHAAIYGAPDGFSYRLPLGAVGGDFTVHYLSPEDDLFFPEACWMETGMIDSSLIRTHAWPGLEALPEALRQQAAGEVLKGIVKIQRASN